MGIETRQPKLRIARSQAGAERRWTGPQRAFVGAIAAARPIPEPLLHPQFAPAALVQALSDPFVAVAMLALCTWIGGVPFAGAELILALIVFSLTYPGIAPRSKRLRTLAADVVAGWLVVVILLLLIGWATETLGLFDTSVLLGWMAATPVAMFVAKAMLSRMLSGERAQRSAVIAGEGDLGRAFAERIRATPCSGVRLVGFFDDRRSQRPRGFGAPEPLGSLSQLADYVKRERIEIIYITLPMASQPRMLRLLDGLADTTASIYFVPDVFLFESIQARMDTVGGMPVIAVCESPFYGINRVIKYVSDMVLATGILVAIAPLLAAIAVGVKLSSPGPVLFKQRRYGVDGREIVIYKFRTMTVQEDGAVIRQATRDDARITPFGRILRRTSLDELPQFINVLQGRMSVVGPRPHAVAHNEQYRKLIKGYMIRHKVKPGITGLAQVNGFRGETDSVEKMQARIECDLAYLRNWSLRLDLLIVLRTIPAALFPRNAY